VNRPFFEHYKICQTAAEVGATQEKILEDLEKDWGESRGDHGEWHGGGDGEDLLVPNPNHQHPTSSDEDDVNDEDGEPMDIRNHHPIQDRASLLES